MSYVTTPVSKKSKRTKNPMASKKKLAPSIENDCIELKQSKGSLDSNQIDTPKRKTETMHNNEQFPTSYESPEFKVGWDDGFGTSSRPNQIKMVGQKKSVSPGLIHRNFRTQRLKATCLTSPRTESIDSHPDCEEFLNWVETILLDKPDSDNPPVATVEATPTSLLKNHVEPSSTPTKEEDLASSAFEQFINSPTPSYKQKSKIKNTLLSNSDKILQEDAECKSKNTCTVLCDDLICDSPQSNLLKNSHKVSNQKTSNKKPSDNKLNTNNSRRKSIDSSEYFNDSINELMVQCSQMVEQKVQNGEYNNLLDDSANDMILACTQQIENQLTKNTMNDWSNAIVSKGDFLKKTTSKPNSGNKVAKKHFLSPNQINCGGGSRKKLCLNNNEFSPSICAGVRCNPNQKTAVKEDISSFLNEDEDMLCAVDIDEIVLSQKIQPTQTNKCNEVTRNVPISNIITKSNQQKTSLMKTPVLEINMISNCNSQAKSKIIPQNSSHNCEGEKNNKTRSRISTSRIEPNECSTNQIKVMAKINDNYNSSLENNRNHDYNILETKNLIKRIKEKTLSETCENKHISANVTSIRSNRSENKLNTGMQDLINGKSTKDSASKCDTAVSNLNNTAKVCDPVKNTGIHKMNTTISNSSRKSINNNEESAGVKHVNPVPLTSNANNIQPKYTQEQITLKKIEAKRRQALLRLKQKSFENII